LLIAADGCQVFAPSGSHGVKGKQLESGLLLVDNTGKVVSVLLVFTVPGVKR